jgi:cyanobactin maturation PatA/PatG family protease
LVVAAAGNEGCDCLHIPAAHPSVLAVGAATAAGEPRESSNWGAQYQTHGILAVGEGLRGALPGGKVAERSGTSTATAIVSGVAGLLMSLDIRRGIAPNGPRIRQLLLESADPCPSMRPSTCRRYLSGVLNVDRAVSLISKKDIKMSVNDPSTHLQSNSPLWEEKNPTGANARSHLALQPPGMPTNALGASCGAPPLQLAGDVVPSACGCGGPSPNAQPVFAFGKVGYGFNSQARFDSFWQHMYDNKNKSPNPYDVDQFLAYLQKNPWDATSVIWTLTLESVPVYAISVAGPNSTYLVDFLKKSLHEQQDDIDIIDRVSIAGVLGGRVTLMTGEQLPVIHPELRGTSSFKIDDLVDHAAGKLSGEGKARQKLATKRDALSQFVDWVYFGPLNFGLAPRDRAINYVATNLFSLEKALDEEHQKIQFHSVDAQPSVVSRTGSDCWDVKLEYFFTDDKTGTARRLFRITVDVSDVVPVTVGKPRYWLSGD